MKNFCVKSLQYLVLPGCLCRGPNRSSLYWWQVRSTGRQIPPSIRADLSNTDYPSKKDSSRSYIEQMFYIL